jgi:hypothetical protein
MLFERLSQEVAYEVLDVRREFTDYPLQDKDADDNQDCYQQETHHSITLPLKWMQLPLHLFPLSINGFRHRLHLGFDSFS